MANPVRKICVVITARPSYSRIRSALKAIETHPLLELQLVVGASAILDRYGSADAIIEKEGFRISRRVYMILEGENPITSAKSTGLGLSEMATVFSDLQPDAVITIADRFETMATAICAAYMNIPLVHVQGGEVSGSIDEKVRHAITKLADIHFVATHKSRERVVRMGENPEKVFTTGCPSIDLAKEALAGPPISDKILFGKFGGVGAHFDLSSGYIVVLQHPVTTEYTQSHKHVIETLKAIADYNIPTLWFWPNVDAGSDGTSSAIRQFREHHSLPKVHFFKNIPPMDFIKILNQSQCIVGNSSVAIRECTYLGVPAINIGKRQNGRERGKNVIDAPYDRQAIKEALHKQFTVGKYESDFLFGNGEAGEKIATLLATVPLTIEKQLTY